MSFLAIQSCSYYIRVAALWYHYIYTYDCSVSAESAIVPYDVSKMHHIVATVTALWTLLFMVLLYVHI